MLILIKLIHWRVKRYADGAGGFSIIMGISFIVVLVLMFSKQRQHFRMDVISF